MGTSWFVRQETRRLPLAGDQWLLVKARLTAGEYRAHLARSSDVLDDGTRRINTLQHGASLIVAYLVDWSLADQVEILGMAPTTLATVLDTLDPDRFNDIRQAIEAHDLAMSAERAAEKNGTAGEKNAVAISPSPYAAAGVSSGSVS